MTPTPWPVRSRTPGARRLRARGSERGVGRWRRRTDGGRSRWPQDRSQSTPAERSPIDAPRRRRHRTYCGAGTIIAAPGNHRQRYSGSLPEMPVTESAEVPLQAESTLRFKPTNNARAVTGRGATIAPSAAVTSAAPKIVRARRAAIPTALRKWNTATTSSPSAAIRRRSCWWILTAARARQDLAGDRGRRPRMASDDDVSVDR